MGDGVQNWKEGGQDVVDGDSRLLVYYYKHYLISTTQNKKALLRIYENLLEVDATIEM